MIDLWGDPETIERALHRWWLCLHCGQGSSEGNEIAKWNIASLSFSSFLPPSFSFYPLLSPLIPFFSEHVPPLTTVVPVQLLQLISCIILLVINIKFRNIKKILLNDIEESVVNDERNKNFLPYFKISTHVLSFKRV